MLTRQELDSRAEIARGFLAVSYALRTIAIKTDTFKDEDVMDALDEVSNHLSAMIQRIDEDMKA